MNAGTPPPPLPTTASSLHLGISLMDALQYVIETKSLNVQAGKKKQTDGEKLEY